MRPSHVVWLRLPADFTRDDARRLIAFVETLVLDSDSQPPPVPGVEVPPAAGLVTGTEHSQKGSPL